jgi:ornithine--oxo-acid transaminase
MEYSNIPDHNIFQLERMFGAQHYKQLNLIVRHAIGCWLTDINSTRYLDCLAAYSAANPGHNHHMITGAIMDAMHGCYGSVISNVVHTDSYSIFLERLCKFVPQLGLRFGNNGNKALLKNGGVESVETAIKAMRYYGWKEKGIEDGKQEIIVFDNNFHGRMITTISFSSTEKYKQGFGPLTKGFVSVPYGDTKAVKEAITPNTCGILVEPMQGEGGMNIPPDYFLRVLRSIANQHDLLLTFDEIQVGLGRTGKDFCFQHEGVIPDCLILGKALSGGLVPLSAFITNSYIMNKVFSIGSDGSTYGGYPLACIAGIAALGVLEKEKLSEKSAKQGKILKDKLTDIAKRSSLIKEVRGKGLFIGIEVNDGNAMSYCKELLREKLLVNDSHGHTIRISPPLIISDWEIDFLCERIERVLVK